MMAEQYTRFDCESYEDYMIRLFGLQAEGKLTCRDIAALLNKDRGQNYGESSYRKFYRAFDAGRRYEARQAEGGGGNRILCISDLHYPYALPVDTFSRYAGLVDVLVLNGDLLDMKEISRFEKCYRQSPMDEIVGCREYLINLIMTIRPRCVVANYGNHDERFHRYLSRNLDTDLIELMPDTPLDLIFNDGFRKYDKERGVKAHYEPLKDVLPADIQTVYSENWWCRVGNTIFAHPSAYSSAMLKTTEKAVNYFLRTEKNFDTIVLAHTHKLGQYIQGGIYMFEQGAACHVESMRYNDGKLTVPQQKGCLYLCQDKDGNLMFDRCKLIAL